MKRNLGTLALELIAGQVVFWALFLAIGGVLWLLDAPGWLLGTVSLALGCVVGWRVAAWSKRQDDIEAHRSEVDT